MDLVVILTDHSGFDYAMIAKFSPLIFDTRNALRDLSYGNVCRL
jgi:UDP-N-acetyl-D-glucosamine dehydrogenase